MVDTKKRITFDIETYNAAFIVTALINGSEWQEYVVCPSVQGYPAKVDCSVVRGWLRSLQGSWAVTYNGKSFDLRVLSWIANCGKETLTTAEIADAAGKLISDLNAKFGHPKTSPCWDVKYSELARVRRQHFDVLKCYTIEHSLKWWEMRRGWAIKETSVPWDKPTLTEKELLDCRRYCRHDVYCTDRLYMEKDCQEHIEARQWVIDNADCEIFPDVPNAELAELYCYGDGETADEIETCFDLVPWEVFKVPEDFLVQMQQIARHQIQSFEWRGITYGAGGAHYAKPGRHKGMKIFDVASLYPHIIWFMTKLKTQEALKRYVDCILKRLENKSKKGTPEYSKSADKGLKLVLNSLSGKFGQKGSKAYAPEHRLAMCIIGQTLITEAACAACGENFENLIEINTDSFAVLGEKEIERARAYCETKPHGFTFEEDDFADSYWKDVNNYFVYKFGEGGLALKEAHGKVGTNLDEDHSETIVTESLALALRMEAGAELALAEIKNPAPALRVDNCVVKYSKAVSSVNAAIDGEPMACKYYYFLWTTPDCPNSHRVQFSSDKVDKYGTVAVRHGVYGFSLEELRQYEQYIDPEQYLEDLKKQLAVWGRKDLFTPMKARNVPDHCETFHEVRQAAGGFFDMPDDLF